MTDAEKYKIIAILIFLLIGMMILGGIAYGLLLLVKRAGRLIRKLFI